MMQELSNQTYSSIVDEHTDNNYNDTHDSDDNAQNPEIAEKISVSEAIRRKEGYVIVKGQVIGCSEIYNMISEIKINCSNCGLFRSNGLF